MLGASPGGIDLAAEVDNLRAEVPGLLAPLLLLRRRRRRRRPGRERAAAAAATLRSTPKAAGDSCRQLPLRVAAAPMARARRRATLEVLPALWARVLCRWRNAGRRCRLGTSSWQRHQCPSLSAIWRASPACPRQTAPAPRLAGAVRHAPGEGAAPLVPACRPRPNYAPPPPRSFPTR